MKRALLVIDVQEQYFSGAMPISHPDPKVSLANIGRAMDAAQERDVPVVVIQHNSAKTPLNSPMWALEPTVAARQATIRIDKTFPGSFTGTGLEKFLRENEIDTVVICGYMTQMCCDTTARQAMHRGYKVEFLSDATGTLAFENQAGRVEAEALHNAVLVVQASAFAQVMTTADWLARL